MKLLLALIAMATATLAKEKAKVLCASTASIQPELHYTISPKFIWFPGAITADEVTNVLEHSLSSASRTAYTSGKAAHSTIRGFLRSPCTLRLTMEGKHFRPGSGTALRLLNYTLGDTDLICRLATHKLGRTYTEVPHTMLSSHLKAQIRSSTMMAKAGKVAETSSVEYIITCPSTAGPTVSGEKAIEVIEGLKGLAQVKDCDWCEKAMGELQSVCKPQIAGLDNLTELMASQKWSFGGARCETCR